MGGGGSSEVGKGERWKSCAQGSDSNYGARVGSQGKGRALKAETRMSKN